MRLKHLLAPAKDKRTQLVRALRDEGLTVVTQGMEIVVQLTALSQEGAFQSHCSQILGGKTKVILIEDEHVLKRFRNTIALFGIAAEWTKEGIVVVRHFQHQERIVMDTHRKLCPDLKVGEEVRITRDGYDDSDLRKEFCFAM